MSNCSKRQSVRRPATLPKAQHSTFVANSVSPFFVNDNGFSPGTNRPASCHLSAKETEGDVAPAAM